MAGKLSGRTILVTGASQGIGAEVAKHCAAEGATVILVARRQKRMEKVYDEIVAAGSPATGGRLDGIVHCASCFTALSPLEFQTVGDWVKQYRINTVGPMGLTRAFTPLLKQSDDASVLFVSESHSEKAQAYWGGFGASKAAVNYLALSIADEWERFDNLRANILIPGAVNSPQREKTHPGESKSERREPADIMPAFIYWLGSESKGRNGETVYL